MNNCFTKRSNGFHGRRFNWLHLAALAAVVALTLSAGAADERAVKTRVAPVYPELAKRMKISGMVSIEATVDADGKVTAVKTLSGNRALSQAAEDAVSRWRYVPAPEATKVDVNLNFNLAQ